VRGFVKFPVNRTDRSQTLCGTHKDRSMIAGMSIPLSGGSPVRQQVINITLDLLALTNLLVIAN
jgi:hypothetical protein